MVDARQCFWAVIEPSPRNSVEYLRSTVATSVANELSCGKYLAVVLEPDSDGYAAAYLVQPASHRPLPETYFPISPCTLGSRGSLVPDFDWPFGECVVNTGKSFVFRVVWLKSDRTNAQYPFSKEQTRSFRLICRNDQDDQCTLDAAREEACKKAARKADGVPDDVSRWTSFSGKSTYVPPAPGQFFPPFCVDAVVSDDIMSLKDILPASRCFEDKRQIDRLRARFSHPATERTIIWNMNQAATDLSVPPREETAPELYSEMVEFSAAIERPPSPDRDANKSKADGELGVNDPWLARRYISRKKPIRPPPPPFDPYNLEIMYFDVYGTLIDNESGIFDALQSLLARCPRQLDRREALALYFESETEMKQLTPTAPYSHILTLAYADMAARLGLAPDHEQSSTFASSTTRWPLFDGAVWCLRMLMPWVPTLVALVDVDYETLNKSSSFAALAPYFAEVYTWEASHTYRPDPRAFDPPLRYHDALGIPRQERCLVSNSVFRDLEPAFALEIPAVWMKYPESLAASVPSAERAVPYGTTKGFPDLVLHFLKATGAFRVAHCV